MLLPKPTSTEEQAPASIPLNLYNQLLKRVNNSFYLCIYTKEENEAGLF